MNVIQDYEIHRLSVMLQLHKKRLITKKGRKVNGYSKNVFITQVV